MKARTTSKHKVVGILNMVVSIPNVVVCTTKYGSVY